MEAPDIMAPSAGAAARAASTPVTPLPADTPVSAPACTESLPSECLVTFVELGKEIEEEYPGTVPVIFCEVWKDRRPAEHSRIAVIPTRVFLARDGKGSSGTRDSSTRRGSSRC